MLCCLGFAAPELINTFFCAFNTGSQSSERAKHALSVSHLICCLREKQPKYVFFFSFEGFNQRLNG